MRRVAVHFMRNVLTKVTMARANIIAVAGRTIAAPAARAAGP